MAAWCGRACALVALLAAATAADLCPARCACDARPGAASCAGAGLGVVPIQLNPEAVHINLTRNDIYNVHFTLAFYTKLVVFDISHNKIDDLGTKNFDSNAELQYLNVSYNTVRRLEKATFFGLKGLLDLDLSFNVISDVHPLSFRDLVRLERLDLSSNKLVSFEAETFKPLANLKVLILDNNGILDIPSSNLMYLIQLEHLSMSSNLIENISGLENPALRRLKRLDIRNNVLSDIENSAFDGLTSVKHMDLSDNNMTVVPTVPLSKLSNMTHLYLSGNFFEIIPAVSFQSLFHLKHLHLSRMNNLNKVDARAFVDNINLEKVWMNDNLHVSSIPSRIFHGNPRLDYISIRNNALITLDASHFPIDQLNELRIAGNPLRCNCSLAWLWHLAQEYKRREYLLNSNNSNVHPLIMDYSEITCSTPEHLTTMLLTNVPESEIRCSVDWMVVATVVMTISLLVSVVGGVLYYLGPFNKCKNDKSKQVMNGVMVASDIPKFGNGLVYSGRQRGPDHKSDTDRYLMIGPPLGTNYRQATAPWQSVDKQIYQDSEEENIYQQFGYETIPSHRTPEKPHIVYV